MASLLLPLNIFHTCSSVTIVNFERVNADWEFQILGSAWKLNHCLGSIPWYLVYFLDLRFQREAPLFHTHLFARQTSELRIENLFSANLWQIEENSLFKAASIFSNNLYLQEIQMLSAYKIRTSLVVLEKGRFYIY